VAGAAFLAQDRLKPHASVGSGFRAPSLYEQTDPFAGNSSLEAQRSRSYDAGVSAVPPALDEVLLDATYFRTDYGTLIDYLDPDGFLGPLPGRYENIHDYSVHGVETSARLAGMGVPYYLRSSYTWQLAREIPGTVANSYSTYLPKHKFDVLIGLLGDRLYARLPWIAVDVQRVWPVMGGFGGTAYQRAYTLVGLSAGWQANKVWELHVRVENLFDVHYETSPGNASSGQALYAGAIGRF
jgi:vitamin B12 transporter